jgi:hypothetical protein
MVRECLAVFFIAAATPVSADCACLYAEGTAKQGETVCIKTATGPTLARCEMMLNNSSWTILGQPCDLKQSRRDIGQQPFVPG